MIYTTEDYEEQREELAILKKEDIEQHDAVSMARIRHKVPRSFACALAAKFDLLPHEIETVWIGPEQDYRFSVSVARRVEAITETADLLKQAESKANKFIQGLEQ